MKAPTIAIVSFAAGLAAGISGMLLLRSPSEPEEMLAQAKAPAPTEGVASGARERTGQSALMAELARLRTENEALAEQLNSTPQEQEEATPAEEDGRSSGGGRFRNFMAARMEAQQRARIAHDRDYFNLSPYQEAQLNSWGEEQAAMVESRRNIMQQLRSGQISREEAQRQIAMLENGSKSYKEALQSVLTGEQLTGFEDYEAQLDHSRREARAYEQLGELARSLVLTEQQKDALFEVFYLQEPPSGLRELPREERMEVWRQYQQDELQRLQGVLTPEQLQLYETRWGRDRRPRD